MCSVFEDLILIHRFSIISIMIWPKNRGHNFEGSPNVPGL